MLVGLCACQLKQLVAPPPPAKLVVSPEKLEDSAVAGSPVALSRGLEIQTEGDLRVNWRASTATNSNWLTLEQTVATAPGTLGLTLHAGSLPPGAYEDTIIVAPEGWPEQGVKIPVTFTVRESTTRLFFTSQPGNTRQGSTLSTVQVTARDPSGRTVTGFTGSVTIALGNNPSGGTLSGTTTVAAVNGVARFSTLRIDRAGTGYTFRATAGVLTVTSNPFNITSQHASGSQSTVSASLASITASGGAQATVITVTARDESGEALADAPVAVSVSGAANTLAPAAGTTDAGGVFTTRLSSTRAEVKTVSATVEGVTLDRTVSVTVAPGNAAVLAFTVQPSPVRVLATMQPAVVVSAFDSYGNLATGFAGEIELDIGHDGSFIGKARLRGDRKVRAAGGRSTFDDLQVDNVGSGFTLVTKAGGGLGSVTSQPFPVSLL
jgi:hypothetical protein